MNTDSPPQTPQRFGIAAATIILAIFLFDVQGSIIKHLGDRYPVTQIALFRNFFGIFPSLVVLLSTVGWRQGTKTFYLYRWPLALLRGFVLVLAQLCFYVSLTKLELATASTLAFAGPLFVTTLSIPMLGHVVGIWRGLAVVVGFVGVVLVMKPFSEVFSVYLLLPVAAAFFYALTSLSSRWFDQSVPTALISLYASFAAMLGIGIVMLASTQYIPVQSMTDWGWLLAMGTAGGFAVLLLITAYRMADPSSLSPFEYLGIPFSFALGWVFFSESPFERLFPGVLFIVGAGLLVLWRERKVAQSTTKNTN